MEKEIRLEGSPNIPKYKLLALQQSIDTANGNFHVDLRLLDLDQKGTDKIASNSPNEWRPQVPFICFENGGQITLLDRINDGGGIRHRTLVKIRAIADKVHYHSL